MIRNKTTKLLNIAMAELGIREESGRQHNNPRIIEYHSVTTLNATTDEIPWCSSFVNWVVIEAGHVPTRSAMAASWKFWGNRLRRPKRGCIIGYVKDDGTGHVGIFLGETRGLYKIIGGNQNDAVAVGNYKIAKKDWFFVEPKVFLNSKTARAGGLIATVGGVTGIEGSSGLMDAIKDLKKNTTEIKSSVDRITDTLATKQTKTFMEYSSPYIVLALAVFVIYDRLRKEKYRDG